jgi:hypothetical protein
MFTILYFSFFPCVLQALYRAYVITCTYSRTHTAGLNLRWDEKDLEGAAVDSSKVLSGHLSRWAEENHDRLNQYIQSQWRAFNAVSPEYNVTTLSPTPLSIKRLSITWPHVISHWFWYRSKWPACFFVPRPPKFTSTTQKSSTFQLMKAM